MVVELPLVFPRFQPEVAVPAGQIIPDPNEEVVDGCIDIVPEVNTVVEEPLAQSAMLIMSPFSVTGYCRMVLADRYPSVTAAIGKNIYVHSAAAGVDIYNTDSNHSVGICNFPRARNVYSATVGAQ